MRRVRTLAIVAVLAAAAGGAGAQSTASSASPLLVLGTSAPTVDGVVASREYSFTKDSGLLVLSVNWTADTLSLAVTGETNGWVGVGVGAPQMDGATIFMGFVDDRGAVIFKPQAGQPVHTHADTTVDVLKTVLSYALKETGETTTLEVALRADAYIRKGQTELGLIFAIGPDDTFTEYHLDRDFVTLRLGGGQ